MISERILTMDNCISICKLWRICQYSILITINTATYVLCDMPSSIYDWIILSREDFEEHSSSSSLMGLSVGSLQSTCSTGRKSPWEPRRATNRCFPKWYGTTTKYWPSANRTLPFPPAQSLAGFVYSLKFCLHWVTHSWVLKINKRDPKTWYN